MSATDPTPPSRPLAGGVLIAIGMIGGAVAGYIWDQPTIGLIAGIAAGALAALGIWLGDRRR
jgi:uncharacterized membrane protein